MKSSSKRTLSILVSFLVLIGVILIYASLITPVYSEIQLKKGELNTKRKELKETKEIVDQAQKLFASFDSGNQAQENINKIIPSDPMYSQAYFQLSSLAGMSGLELKNINAKESTTIPSLKGSLVKGLGTVRFTGNLTGSYESLKNFLNYMESNIRIFNMNSLKVEKIGDANAFNILFEVSTYYQTQ